MTKELVRTRVEQNLSEYFESYVVVGKVVGQPKFVIMHHPYHANPAAPVEKLAADAGMVSCLYDVADTIAGPAPKRN